MSRFVPVFVSSIFLSTHFGILLYVNSTLLSQFFEPSVVSFIFLIGAVGNITLFLFVPKLIGRFGKRLLFFFFLLLAAFATLGLTFAGSASLVAFSFIVYASVLLMAFYCLDIFLEELSADAKTGEIRGTYLTFMNLGIAIGPLLLSVLANGDELRPIYLAAVLLLIVPILFSVFSFKSKMPKWHRLHSHTLLPFKLWWQTKSVRRITLAKLVLEFFFAIMIIYTPVYLHQMLGFEWSTLGFMFAIMLLPFVLFQWPVGELADRYFGEKEFMALGFFVMAVMLVFMPYLEASVIIWTLVLFLSRVGASFVEVTTDSYFFKHVDAKDTGLLSIFRLTRPASIVLGAAIGTLSMSLFPFEKIFIVLAFFVLFGLVQSLSLKDTR